MYIFIYLNKDKQKFICEGILCQIVKVVTNLLRLSKDLPICFANFKQQRDK